MELFFYVAKKTICSIAKTMRGMFELVKPNTNSISGYSNCFPFLENAFENWVNYELKEAFYLACYKNGIKCFLPCCISFSFFKEENPSIASSYLLWLQAIKKVLSLEGSSSRRLFYYIPLANGFRGRTVVAAYQKRALSPAELNNYIKYQFY